MNIDRPARHIRLPWKRRRDQLPNENETLVSRHVPLIGFLPLAVKNHLVAMMAEFVGTFLFLLFALGGTNVVNAAPADAQPADLAANPAKILFISLCFGMSLAVNAWVFFRISGGLFNPAVSLSLSIPALLTSTGLAGYDGRWRRALPSRLPCHRCTDSGRHRCVWYCCMYASRPAQCANIAWRWYIRHAGTFH